MVNQPTGSHGLGIFCVVRQTRIAKFKSAYNSLIIGPRGLGWQTNLWEIMGWESFDVV